MQIWREGWPSHKPETSRPAENRSFSFPPCLPSGSIATTLPFSIPIGVPRSRQRNPSALAKMSHSVLFLPTSLFMLAEVGATSRWIARRSEADLCALLS